MVARGTWHQVWAEFAPEERELLRQAGRLAGGVSMARVVRAGALLLAVRIARDVAAQVREADRRAPRRVVPKAVDEGWRLGGDGA